MVAPRPTLGNSRRTTYRAQSTHSDTSGRLKTSPTITVRRFPCSASSFLW